MDKEAWWQKVSDDPHMVWCRHAAAPSVAGLGDAGLLQPSELERAEKIVAEEIFVRFLRK